MDELKLAEVDYITALADKDDDTVSRSLAMVVITTMLALRWSPAETDAWFKYQAQVARELRTDVIATVNFEKLRRELYGNAGERTGRTGDAPQTTAGP
jgi:hypothetical protein